MSSTLPRDLVQDILARRWQAENMTLVLVDEISASFTQTKYRTTLTVSRVMSSNVCEVSYESESKANDQSPWDPEDVRKVLAHLRNDEELLADVLETLCHSYDLLSSCTRDGYVSYNTTLKLRAVGDIACIALPRSPGEESACSHIAQIWKRPDVRRLLRIFVKNSCA